ncbi:palmitoyltransferase ZDHHC20-B-like isoform X1 [Pectinophora gossypiella]|uniref:palmitoyltransferase ZDHHC20-B-like isoform X1 n=1 Tax=Pectinophora gossypiella TaxID=13191 RepID=UPI00214E2B13|nr:palmitoyltransferase ZDHHC20-B-like isoform X1 [Pectinophora gossypiella]
MMASSVQNNRAAHSGYCVCCRKCNMMCWKAFKWIPVLLIVSIVAWSYYAYVIQLCVFTITSTVQQCVYLILFHILLFMFIWSYWRTIFAEIKPVPDKYKLPEAELEKLLSAESEDAQRSVLENFAHDLPIVTRTMSGSVRYCNRCVLIKPDRAHHCSICARCVLKMDHHCPWVNNCVCYFNYKFFMLFLGYALLYCLFIMATCLPYFIKFWKGEFGTAAATGRYHIVFAFFVSLMFAISLGSLFGYHCYLVANNRTTLEAFRAPMFRGGADKNGFSVGYFNNFKEVFGNRPNLWMLPVFTSLGDGCDFPVRREHELQAFTTPQQEPHGYESMGTTRSSGEVGHETERWRLCPRKGRTVPQIV